QRPGRRLDPARADRRRARRRARGGPVNEVVLSGPLLLAAAVAALAGLVSFASPCVLPLVPGFLGYVGGMTSAADSSRRRLLLGAALFVAGFTAVFLAM